MNMNRCQPASPLLRVELVAKVLDLVAVGSTMTRCKTVQTMMFVSHIPRQKNLYDLP